MRELKNPTSELYIQPKMRSTQSIYFCCTKHELIEAKTAEF